MRQSQCLAPLRKRRPRHWKVYESQVFKLFKEHFPHATVRRNVHVRGRYSRRKRQIDVLLIEQTPAGIVKTIIDTKLFKRKVDVKAVDALAGFVDDVGAQKGMLITACGYTGSALRRAFYGPADLELDPENAYWSIRELLPALAKLSDHGRATELMLSLLRLDPRNPTVFNDCFAFGAGWIERSTMLGIIETVRREHAADPMVQANCDYYSANLLACDDAAAARKLFIAARRQFSILLPSDHQVFRALRVALKRFPPS